MNESTSLVSPIDDLYITIMFIHERIKVWHIDLHLVDFMVDVSQIYHTLRSFGIHQDREIGLCFRRKMHPGDSFTG